MCLLARLAFFFSFFFLHQFITKGKRVMFFSIAFPFPTDSSKWLFLGVVMDLYNLMSWGFFL